MIINEAHDLKTTVKEKYGQAALRVTEGNTQASCCGSSACCGSTTESWDPITSNLYEDGQMAGIPAEALLASLGCGNPTALAELKEGETVLDLGSGGGIDVLLSAKRVGPTGKAYGLDMTDEMLALANQNKQKAGAENVEFLKGEIESIPLPDESVDVGEVPAAVRRNMELWVGCVAGALEEKEYERLLDRAGFTSIDIEPTRIYRMEDAAAFLAGSGLDEAMLSSEIDGRFMSAFVRAKKPDAPASRELDVASESCCGSECCA